jgi:hypothetical protein
MSSVHVEAAKNGEQAIEVDLFHLVDTDHSGHLERHELRHLLAAVRSGRTKPHSFKNW